jgi:predicted phosphodiesterase
VRFDVFAVEDTSVQVCWRGGPATLRAEWAGEVRSSHLDAPAGAVIVNGLPPSTTVRLRAAGARSRTITTLAPPPGARVSRFAAINDVHLGSRQFGTFRPIWNDDIGDPAPLRCLRAALDEALEWGADALLVKGDLTQRGRTHEWKAAGALLEKTGLPVVMIEGNHETKLGAVDGRRLMASCGIELAVHRPSVLDLPGVRVIGVPNARWHEGDGCIHPDVQKATLRLLDATPTGIGAVIALHHYPQRFRFPTLYPSGMPGPHATAFLNAVAEVKPDTLVLAGHSHRHRRHQHGPLAIAETGSTKDFPGSWAGYTVYEGGILQTTRRVMEPSAFAWTERGRRVLGGAWGLWAPGFRTHRCFAHVWPRPANGIRP